MLLLAIWSVVAIIGLFGWGSIIALILHRNLPNFRTQPPLLISLGLSVFSLIAAFGQLFGIPGKILFPSFAMLGSSFLVYTQFKKIKSIKIIEFLLKLFPLFVIFTISIGNFVNRLFNWCDDQPVYIFFVKNLWMNGDIQAEYSLRRLVASGLFASMQTYGIGFGRELNINSFDFLIAPILILIAFCYKPNVRLKIGTFLLLILVMLNGRSLGTINSSPILSVVLCTWLLYRVFIWAKENSSSGRNSPWLFLGFYVGFCFALRPYLGVFGIFFLLFYFLLDSVSPKKFLRYASTFLGFVISYAPWSYVQYRDSGSVMYPLFVGNLKDNFLFEGNPHLVGLFESLSVSFYDLHASRWLYFLIFLLVLAFSSAFHLNQFTRLSNDVRFALDSKITLSACLALTFFYFLFNYSVRREGNPTSYSRYWVPIFVATLIFVLDLIISSLLVLTKSYTSRSFLNTIAVGTACLVISYPFFDNPYLEIHLISKIRSFNTAVIQNMNENVTDFEKVKGRLQDAKVLSAMDLPGKLSSYAKVVSPLDLPGMATPDEEFPYGKSYELKVNWLKSQEFDYLAFTEPALSMCLYSTKGWVSNLGVQNQSGDWAPTMLEWGDFVNQISERNQDMIVRVNADLVIPIKRIQ